MSTALTSSPEIYRKFTDWSSLQIVQTLNRYATLAPIAILLYDYCITFNTEVENFWRGFAFTWASLLFVTNRYLSVLIAVAVLLQSFMYLPETLSHGITTLLIQNSVSGISTAAVSIWAIFNGGRINVNVDTLPPVNYRHACDLSLTNDETLRSDAFWRRRGLFYVILRDGALCYGIITLTNAVNVTTLMVPVTVKFEEKGIFITATNVVSSVLISRLVLNLRDQGRRIAPLQSSTYNIDNGLSWETDERNISFHFHRVTNGESPQVDPYP
ncbi:hypothetical protein CERSUDRAFT_122655 [Gelatoporia subvermispora B]|uniref:DUF6533 domain-containing protein n=1 Tax=Ceriporiopsis subvermispora (strain B) TaxID=914234 RepID=M2QQ72_CERS8|nr:hypothetical protein CERSUDRAFT_122655 [Gelatoporia subvermispora B]